MMSDVYLLIALWVSPVVITFLAFIVFVSFDAPKRGMNALGWILAALVALGAITAATVMIHLGFACFYSSVFFPISYFVVRKPVERKETTKDPGDEGLESLLASLGKKDLTD
jgi:hypothetical protein